MSAKRSCAAAAARDSKRTKLAQQAPQEKPERDPPAEKREGEEFRVFFSLFVGAGGWKNYGCVVPAKGLSDENAAEMRRRVAEFAAGDKNLCTVKPPTPQLATLLIAFLETGVCPAPDPPLTTRTADIGLYYIMESRDYRRTPEFAQEFQRMARVFYKADV